MKKEQLVKERELLQEKIIRIDKEIDNLDLGHFETLSVDSMDKYALWQIADIIRTSPIVNPNYPDGHNCSICESLGNKCSYDSDDYDCNIAFVQYFARELLKRDVIIK